MVLVKLTFPLLVVPPVSPSLSPPSVVQSLHLLFSFVLLSLAAWPASLHAVFYVSPQQLLLWPASLHVFDDALPEI